MSDVLKQPNMTEPLPIDDAFVEGVEIEAGTGFVRLIGWCRYLVVEYPEPETRIVLRSVMTKSAARQLIKALRSAVGHDGE